MKTSKMLRLCLLLSFFQIFAHGSDPDWLIYLNNLRELHSVPPLKISQQLTDAAQQVAEWNNKLGFLKHSNLKYGENMAYIPSGNIKTAITLCYNEIKDYDFANPGFTAGHFTQLVWKGTTEIGIGVSNSFIAMEFNPPGNMYGGYKYNVFPAKNSSSVLKSPTVLKSKYSPPPPPPVNDTYHLIDETIILNDICVYNFLIGIPKENIKMFKCYIPDIKVENCSLQSYSTTKKYMNLFFIDNNYSKQQLIEYLKNIAKDVFPSRSTVSLINNQTVLFRMQL